VTATLLDTGPLIAAVDRDDKHHASCVRLLEELEGPLLAAFDHLDRGGMDR
jgi:predicted nucleic acid-binding protein